LQGGKLVTDGKGRFTLKQGRFPLLEPILALDSIDLKKFSVELDLKNNILECQKGKFHGRELDGNFSGTVTLQSGLQNARLSFAGEIEPLPDLLKENKEAQEMVIQLQKKRKRGTLPFVLKGTVQKPSFTFVP
jgi:type II secretion system protein N